MSDRSVSSSIRLSALEGLTDFLWFGGMCESPTALAEWTADQRSLPRLRNQSQGLNSEGVYINAH